MPCLNWAISTRSIRHRFSQTLVLDRLPCPVQDQPQKVPVTWSFRMKHCVRLLPSDLYRFKHCCYPWSRPTKWLNRNGCYRARCNSHTSIQQDQAITDSESDSILSPFFSPVLIRASQRPWLAGWALDFHSRYDGDANVAALSAIWSFATSTARNINWRRNWLNAGTICWPSIPNCRDFDAVVPVPPSLQRASDPMTTVGASACRTNANPGVDHRVDQNPGHATSKRNDFAGAEARERGRRICAQARGVREACYSGRRFVRLWRNAGRSRARAGRRRRKQHRRLDADEDDPQ